MLKKYLTILICFNILILPAYCTISDDFVEKTLSNKQKVMTVQQPVIKDTFVEKTINTNAKYKPAKNNVIIDSFAENNKNKNQYTKPVVDFSEQKIIVSQKTTQPRKIAITNEENSIPIKIRVKNYISTKQKFDEGDFIEFETLSEVKIKNKVYPAGTIVKARIETISYNKIWGVPSDLIIGNFSIDGKRLAGEISKTGANRSLWLYPTIYMTTLFFGVGLLLIPIRGGHAKIKPQQSFTVYYQH